MSKNLQTATDIWLQNAPKMFQKWPEMHWEKHLHKKSQRSMLWSCSCLFRSVPTSISVIITGKKILGLQAVQRLVMSCPYCLYSLNATNRTHIWANPSFSLQHSKGCCIRWHLASPSTLPSPEAVGLCNHVVISAYLPADIKMFFSKILHANLGPVMPKFPRLEGGPKHPKLIRPWRHSRKSKKKLRNRDPKCCTNSNKFSEHVFLSIPDTPQWAPHWLLIYCFSIRKVISIGRSCNQLIPGYGAHSPRSCELLHPKLPWKASTADFNGFQWFSR